MSRFILLAWRNIGRNKRRSLITISAVSFAVVMVALTRSLQYGTYDVVESVAVQLFNGEIQVQRRGFQEEQALAYFLSQDQVDWERLVRSVPEIADYTRRITGFGLVSSDSSSAGALIVGIEPEREARITKFSTLVRKGRRLARGDRKKVLLGETLAKNLQVDIGDTVVVLTQGYRNQLGADVYVLKGVVRVGHAQLDRALMVMPLRDAQELFSLDSGVTQIVFSTVDFRKAPDITRRIEEHLPNSELEALSWHELMPELKQIIVVDNVSGAIYLGFILIVVGIEIFNATMMNIIERTREFGVLQAMGMKPYQISALILMESFIKVSIALTLGLILSFLVISILSRFSIPLPAELREAYASYGFVIEDIKFSDRIQVYIEPLVSIAIIAALALMLPMLKTARLSPMEAFRKV